ncbi:M60 family metallopeptidase [Paenibacillus dendritiformis]|uniref:M60 family metallopeptidase n=1 Tax=Paenibacillus dendritiformis TaxID=130049 RepID=UPI00387E17A5
MLNKKLSRISAFCSMTLAVSLLQPVLHIHAEPATYAQQSSSSAVATVPSYSQHDLDVLSRDLAGIPLDGNSYNGGVAAFGEHAFAVAADPRSTSIMAAARYGQGRIAAIGGEAYFKLTAPDTSGNAIVARNILNWITEGLPLSYEQARTGQGRIAIITKTSDFAARPDLPIDITHVDRWTTTDEQGKALLDPAAYPVAFIDYTYVEEEEVQPLLDYIREGGRLVLAAKGWVFEQYPSVSKETDQATASLASDYPLQRLLNKAGLSLMNNQATTWDGSAPFLNLTQAAHYNANHIMAEAKAIEAGTKTIGEATIGFSDSDDKAKMNIITSTLGSTLGSLSPASPAYAQVQEDASKLGSITLPVEPAAKPYSASLLPALMERLLRDPAGAKSPFADAFPGKALDGAPAVTGKRIWIDFDYSTYSYLRQFYVPQNWISTGVYAEAGKPITIDVPQGTTNLDVQIGAHTDNLSSLSLDNWKRAPVITKRETLSPGRNTITSPYGGLVYLIPTKPKPGTTVTVNLNSGVQAPHYIKGTTKLKDWQNTIRHYGAPWAELQTDRVILTLPSEYVRNLDHPDEVLKLWDEMLTEYDKLVGTAPNRSLPHRSISLPYRYVGDIQISAGFMHAGYPIMFFNDPSAIDAVTVDGIKTLDGWGWWHETGHEYQQNAWTWGKVTEVTVNIFSLYIQDHFGNPSRLLQKRSDGTTIYDTAVKYIEATNADKNFNDDNQADVWTRLVMFRQLQLAYGWDLYTKLNHDVREMPADLLPKTDQERIDLFVTKASQLSGNNLLEFFDKWGLKYSAAAKNKVEAMKLPKPKTPIWTLKDKEK